MPNTEKSAELLQGNSNATLSHETANSLTYLNIPLPGTNTEKIQTLQLYMRMLTTFIMMAIESDFSNENEMLRAAITLYRETDLKRSYILQGVDD